MAILLLPCLVLTRFQAILAGWCRSSPVVIRAGSMAAVAFGNVILGLVPA